MKRNSKNVDLKKYKYQVINIKLQSEKEGIERENAYYDLIKKMQSRKIHSSVAENMHMIIYNSYERTLPEVSIKYLYGNLGKGIYFEDEIISSINIEESKDEYLETNRNQILEPKNAEYIFVPQIHKFIFINNEGVTINNVYKFLKESLPKVTDKEDIVQVEIIKDPKITEDILKAFKIHSLDYTISYTNDDPTKSVEKLLDKRLKKIYAGKLSVQIEADNKGQFNMDEPDELLEGGIKLAEQNGQINKAVITQTEGENKITLSNKETPRFFEVEASDDNYKESIVKKVIKVFFNL